MRDHIFLKLRKRIEEGKFDKIRVGKMDMMGMRLSKADWKRYKKQFPSPVYHSKVREGNEIGWFRGYPLKEK